MAYSAGNTIIDDDYNIFATGNASGTPNNGVRNINTIWGSGSATYGYGQSTTVAAVSAGSTITATQWATLLTRMTSIANHQGTSITAIGNPSAGTTISAYTALDSNITTLFGTSRLRAAGSGADKFGYKLNYCYMGSNSFTCKNIYLVFSGYHEILL
jgi:hypothetical protein